MDNLLIVGESNSLPESLLQSLCAVGWKLSLTTDLVLAKQLLQKKELSGVLIQLNPEHGLARLKIVRFVQEFCPNTLVVVFHSTPESTTKAAGNRLVQVLDTVGTGHAAAHIRVLPNRHLTPAQTRIAVLVTQAYPNREIARILKIKNQSVRNELTRIFRKTGVCNRVELALWMRTNARPGQLLKPSTWGTGFEFPHSAMT